jgi:hypothetical protein
MLLLPARPGVRTPAEGSHQRPVVCENGEGASLQHEAEVFDGGYYSEKLPIESAVVDLSLIQLGREKTKGTPPLPGPFLLNNRPHM